MLGSSLTPERIDWWSGPLAVQAGLQEQPLLLLSLASVSAQTLEEQIQCLLEQARLAGDLVGQPLDGERLEALQAIAQGPNTPRTTGCCGRGAARSGGNPPGGALSAGVSLVLAAGSGLGLAWAPASTLPAYRVEELRRLCRSAGGALTVLQQPPPAAIPAWEDAPSRPLIEAVKRQFDPQLQLARGRLPGVQSPQPASGSTR